MLLLVLAGNFVLLIVGWAFVGFASYALISFWYRRDTATKAGMKAFVINVIGDVGLVLAAFFIFRELGTFDYRAVFEAAPQHFTTNEGVVVAICLLILVGAFAKSAQLPLHTWLPDAMEGPTPVSALIHAATMVTAGVYLIARTHVLFELAPTAADIAAFIGLATLLFAGHGRARRHRPEADHRLLDDQPDRLHGGRRLDRRLLGRALPPDDPRLLQGAAVHGGRLDHRRDGRAPGHRPDERLPPGDAVHLGDVDHRRAGARRLPRARRASSRRTRSSASPSTAAACTAIFAIGGYIGALPDRRSTPSGSSSGSSRASPCEEARELERGHLAHAEPENPATGEREDTDVGFPGPEHHIAERELPMKVAMAVLAVPRRSSAAASRSRASTTWSTKFLEPTLRRLAAVRASPCRPAAEWVGLGDRRRLISIARHRRSPSSSTSRGPGMTAALARARSRPLHTFLVNKWYFDELLRRARRTGRRSPSAASPTRCSSGWSCNGIVSGTVGRRPRGRRRRPRRPVGLRPRLRAAAGGRLRRPRPLLPDREQLMAARP